MARGIFHLGFCSTASPRVGLMREMVALLFWRIGWPGRGLGGIGGFALPNRISSERVGMRNATAEARRRGGRRGEGFLGLIFWGAWTVHLRNSVAYRLYYLRARCAEWREGGRVSKDLAGGAWRARGFGEKYFLGVSVFEELAVGEGGLVMKLPVGSPINGVLMYASMFRIWFLMGRGGCSLGGCRSRSRRRGCWAGYCRYAGDHHRLGRGVDC